MGELLPSPSGYTCVGMLAIVADYDIKPVSGLGAYPGHGDLKFVSTSLYVYRMSTSRWTVHCLDGAEDVVVPFLIGRVHPYPREW